MSGRTSVAVRPSTRSPVSTTILRMACFSRLFSSTGIARSHSACSSSVNSALMASFRSSTLPMRDCLSASFRAADISSKCANTRSCTSGMGSSSSYSRTGNGPLTSMHFWKNFFSSSQNAAMASWPNAMAASMSSSEISFAPASSMEMNVADPPSSRSRSELSRSSYVGFTRNSPVSTSRPMRTPASGPSNGTPPTVSAAEAPMMQMVSTEFTWSATSGIATIWTSFLKPSGKDGRMGRSIMRAVRVAFSLGRASRFR